MTCNQRQWTWVASPFPWYLNPPNYLLPSLSLHPSKWPASLHNILPRLRSYQWRICLVYDRHQVTPFSLPSWSYCPKCPCSRCCREVEMSFTSIILCNSSFNCNNHTFIIHNNYDKISPFPPFFLSLSLSLYAHKTYHSSYDVIIVYSCDRLRHTFYYGAWNKPWQNLLDMASLKNLAGHMQHLHFNWNNYPCMWCFIKPHWHVFLILLYMQIHNILNIYKVYILPLSHTHTHTHSHTHTNTRTHTHVQSKGTYF